MGKYDGDEFNDPVVRCTECQKLLFLDELRKVGRCECGCRKVRNVLTVKDFEVRLMENKQIDPEFIAQFEERAV